MTYDPWDALGDPTRRTIFRTLVQRPRAVGELAREFPISRPAVSQHLKVLKNARLVVDRADGARRVYAPNGQGIAVLREELDQFWERALGAFKAASEVPEKTVRKRKGRKGR